MKRLLLNAKLICSALFAVSLQAQAPVVPPNGVVNAADYTADFSPGMLISIYGTNLGRALQDTTVEVIDGSRTVNAPLLLVTPGQVNAQLPYGLTSSQVLIRAKTALGTSASVSLNLSAASPKFLTKAMDGKGEAILLHASYTMVSAESPALAGEVVILYMVGLGDVTPAIEAGKPANDGLNGSLNSAVADVAVQVGGQPAKVLYAGLAPHYAGLYQVNFQMPELLLTGAQLLSVTAKLKATQANITAFASSPWRVTGESTVGPLGGEVAAAGLSLTIPSGVFASPQTITVWKNQDAASQGASADQATDSFAISGLPTTLAAPLNIRLNLNRQPEGGTYIVVSTNTGQGDGSMFFNGTVSGGQLSVAFPTTRLTPSAASAKDREAAIDSRVSSPGPSGKQLPDGPRDPVSSHWMVHGVDQYRAITSPSGKFSIVYPTYGLAPGTAEAIAKGLDDAYSKVDKLKFDWGKRSGLGSWPITVSIYAFPSGKSERWGEEGSAFWGTVRQGINLNASFLNKPENLENMRITAGHELFHLMQNLYDPASAPSAWLWMEEAASTWFERRVAQSPSYIPEAVLPTAVVGNDNYSFLVRRGLEFSPGDPGKVQEHGYGASLFLEYLTNRYGDAVLEGIIRKMEPAIQNRSIYSPVEAINAATGGISTAWQGFCETFMAGQVYKNLNFPRPEVELAGMWLNRYIWESDTQPGPTFTANYQDLSARLFLLNIKDPPWKANTTLTVRLDAPGGEAVAILYKMKLGPPTTWEKVGLVTGSLDIANAEQLRGSILLIMVVNSRAVAPYDGRRDIGISVKVKSSDWTSINVALTIPMIIKRLDGTMAKASYFQMMAPEANRPGNPLLKWNGNDFSYTSSGRSTSALSNPGDNQEYKWSGTLDPATNTLVNLRAYQSWSKDLSTTTRTYKTEHVEEISIRGVTCQLVNNAWLRCQASGADTANKAQVITYFEHHTEGEKGKETSSGFDFVSLDSTDSTVKPALSVSFQK